MNPLNGDRVRVTAGYLATLPRKQHAQWKYRVGTVIGPSPRNRWEVQFDDLPVRKYMLAHQIEPLPPGEESAAPRAHPDAVAGRGGTNQEGRTA